MVQTAPGGGNIALTGTAIVAEVEKLGKAALGYELGGTGPQYYDCSGLIQTALESLGVAIVPRTSEEQWAWVDKISASQLQAGDLVFAQFPGDSESPGHVGIYVGNGQVYSAQDPALGIGLSSLSSWGGNIVGYGKVPGSAETGAAGTAPGTAGPSTGPLSLGIPAGLINSLGDLYGWLKYPALLLDKVFGLFGHGQGWRLVFGIGALVAIFAAYHAYTGSAIRLPGGASIG